MMNGSPVILQQTGMRLGLMGNKIVLEFDRPIDHMQFTDAEAVNFIQQFVNTVNNLRKQTGDGKLIGAKKP